MSALRIYKLAFSSSLLCRLSHSPILLLSLFSSLTLPLPHSLSLGGMSHRRERRKERRGGVFVCTVCVRLCVHVLCHSSWGAVPFTLLLSFMSTSRSSCWSPGSKGMHSTHTQTYTQLYTDISIYLSYISLKVILCWWKWSFVQKYMLFHSVKWYCCVNISHMIGWNHLHCDHLLFFLINNEVSYKGFYSCYPYQTDTIQHKYLF